MLFARILSVALLFTASTAAMEKRSARRDVQALVKTTLTITQFQVQTISTQIQNTLADESLTAEQIAAKVQKGVTRLEGIITDAATQVGGFSLKARKRGIEERELTDDIAELIAELIETVVNLLDAIQAQVEPIPQLGPVLAQLIGTINAPLQQLLLAVNAQIDGVLAMVGQLLDTLGLAAILSMIPGLSDLLGGLSLPGLPIGLPIKA
ncbi:hypothetical protein MNV49_001347 [Pseudohyphozyma bogoriensis]|nr:hypothetical protein MNV49_001347 [Pseudohyphozyma bogoriensis]